MKGIIGRFNIEKLKNTALFIPQWVGENAFLGFLILLFIALILSSFVFYKYIYVTRDIVVVPETSGIKFEGDKFQNITHFRLHRPCGI